MKVRVGEWLVAYLQDRSIENLRYNYFLKLIDKSQYEGKVIHDNVDYYKQELVKIRDMSY